MTAKRVVPKRTAVLVILLLVVAGVGAYVWYSQPARPRQRIYDEAKILSEPEQFTGYLGSIFQESDVDIRIVTVKSVGGRSIEEAAVERMQALGVGAEGREERGLLFFYDVGGARLRIETGYGLEEVLPDSFVGYLMHDHAPAFFANAQVTLGLHLGIRIVHDRIREASLGQRFDPTALTVLRRRRALSGGAGASGVVPISAQGDDFRKPLDPTDKERFAAGETPEETYARYLEWLTLDRFDPDVGLFTPQSRVTINRPMSKAYSEYIFLKEYGKKYVTEVRGDLALMYCTNNPLADPHMLRMKDGRWQMDLVAEIQDTRNATGGVFAWFWRGKDDDFSRAFADKIVKVKGWPRIAGGDNRLLPTRDALAGSADTKGWTKLHFAAARGQVEEVRKLLDGRTKVDVTNAKGRTPLYEAAKRGRLDVARLLLDRGAAVNAREGTIGFTPLHVASEYQHLDVARLLLSKGADAHARNAWEQTPLHQVAWQAWQSDADVPRLLLDHGADPNARDNRGFTPLVTAAAHGYAEAVRAMLDRGADINARTARGSTALFDAANAGHLETVKLLLERGADATLGFEGRTPLSIAQKRKHDMIVALLRQYQESQAAAKR